MMTLFTKWTKKVGSHFNVTVDGRQLPSSWTTQVLGVTLDPLLTFSQHIRNTCKKVGQRNNILQKLARSDWGCTKDVLLPTYMVIGCSVMKYVSLIWTPSLSDSRWGDLQVKQKAALRTVTGCHAMTSVPHLHHKTRLMMVGEHNELLSIQFLLGVFKERPPDHRTTEQPPPGSRQVSPTLLAKFGDRLLDHVGQ